MSRLKPVHRIFINGAATLVGVGAIAWALVAVQRPDAPPAGSAPPEAGQVQISRSELARNDGRNGNKCYVAVDGTVYLIEGRPLWADGRHLPSEGRAMCGQDLSTVIDHAPHGRSKLQTLTVVGKLEQ